MFSGPLDYAVSLPVDGVDLPWLNGACRRCGGLEHDDTGHELRGTVGDGCAPAEEDGVAVVPEVELLEGDVGLSTLASLESRERVEGDGAELLTMLDHARTVVPSHCETYGNWAGAAGVNQSGNGVGVVVEASGQGSRGSVVAVVGDQAVEVGCDPLCLIGGHAGAVTLGVHGHWLRGEEGVRAERERRGSQRQSRDHGGGAHYCDFGGGRLKSVWLLSRLMVKKKGFNE